MLSKVSVFVKPHHVQLFSDISGYEIYGIRFQLQQTRRNDAILIINGQASPQVSDSDPMVPGQTIARILPMSKNPEPERAKVTAEALNDYLTYSYRVLTDHEVNRQRRTRNLPPANFLATQRCGRRIAQEPFNQRWGMAGMLIAAGPYVRWLGP